MPARMWRYGIHSFLELLRHRLPGSLEHMITFTYLAYSMMALFYETVPAFEDTWVECLGDLGRYRYVCIFTHLRVLLSRYTSFVAPLHRGYSLLISKSILMRKSMAIEDDDIRDRQVWTSVSRYWYLHASHKAPTTGRLYHHLAILSQPNALQQLFYYTKSLCAQIPFEFARESIMTMALFNGNRPRRLSNTEAEFLKAHAILFTRQGYDDFEDAMSTFLKSLEVNEDLWTNRSWGAKRWVQCLNSNAAVS